MVTRWMVVAALAACTPAKAPAPPSKIDIAATALATIDRDANAMLELVRALYLEAGVTVATNVTLELGGDDARTSYDDTLIRITLPAPATSPDQARAYWQAQGKPTGVAVDELVTDDVERYRLARFAVFVALAHEVGHFLHQSYVGPLEPAERELLADRLAIALLDRLAVRPELAELTRKYRALLTKWYAAIPDDVRVEIPADAELDAWVADHPLPADPAAATSLALARQLRLLAKPPKLGPLVAEALLAPHDLRLQKIEYGATKLVVTSGRDVPPAYRAVTGTAGSTVRELQAALLGPDNKFRAVACSGGACDITGEAGTSTKLALTNVLGGEMASYPRVLDVTISGDQLWLLLAGTGEAPETALAVIDLARPDAVRPTATWPDVIGGRLAASPSGAVSVLLQRPDSWTVDRYDSPAAKPASWTFKVADGGDTDGRAGAAGGALGDCTANDAGTIYCAAGVRIRVLEKDRLWTLAGGNRDWVDATDPRKVAFTSPVRLRATPTGLVLVDRKYAEDGTATWKVRQIELRK